MAERNGPARIVFEAWTKAELKTVRTQLVDDVKREAGRTLVHLAEPLAPKAMARKPRLS